mmetsp:Transcript_81290/g.263664  ORF Transcript_81290/g.263664 Transcript_81290/m.263664 type:complete len:614 (+) Transcript_81290:74-1915(+)
MEVATQHVSPAAFVHGLPKVAVASGVRVPQKAFAGRALNEAVPLPSAISLGAAGGHGRAFAVLSAAASSLAAARRRTARAVGRHRRARGGAEVAVLEKAQQLGVECSTLRVGIPKESGDGEARVAATPASVQALCKEGYKVLVESGAGLLSDFDDAAYEAAGATIAKSAGIAFDCDIVMKVRPPTLDEISLMPAGSTLIGIVGSRLPGSEPLVERLMAQKINVVAVDNLPRQLSRAQTYDTLSSMANLAGYRAVIEGSVALPRFMAGQFTAAGKVEPAKVLVIGAGVAGLAAIQAAHNLGAIVRAFDVRSSVREQIESVGAEFLTVNIQEDGEGKGGYAKEMSKEFLEAEMALFKKQCGECDIVITTALIPGKPAPKLIKQYMVDIMKRGSVIVDLAAANGGNCEATVPGEKFVTKNGVTILGTDMVQSAAAQASELFSNNVSKFLLSMGEKGRFHLSEADEAVRGCWLKCCLSGWPVYPWPPARECGDGHCTGASAVSFRDARERLCRHLRRAGARQRIAIVWSLQEQAGESDEAPARGVPRARHPGLPDLHLARQLARPGPRMARLRVVAVASTRPEFGLGAARLLVLHVRPLAGELPGPLRPERRCLPVV